MSSSLSDDLQSEIGRTKARMRVRNSRYDGAWLLCLLMGTVDEASYLENVRAADGSTAVGKTAYKERYERIGVTLVEYINRNMNATRTDALQELHDVFAVPRSRQAEIPPPPPVYEDRVMSGMMVEIPSGVELTSHTYSTYDGGNNQ